MQQSVNPGQAALAHPRLRPGQVVQQHREVPGRVRLQRVLEVEQADPRGARPVRQPDQVLGVVVAVAEDRRAGLAADADGRPERLPLFCRGA